MNKLYCVKTSSGNTIIPNATLDYLQTKFEFSLNDLVEAEIIKVGEELSRKLKMKAASEIYKMLAGKKEVNEYLITVERCV